MADGSVFQSVASIPRFWNPTYQIEGTGFDVFLPVVVCGSSLRHLSTDMMQLSEQLEFRTLA